MNRRGWWGVAVGTLAAAVGAGWAWRQGSPGSRGLKVDLEPGAAETFWTLRFDQPGGGLLPVSSLRGKPVLLNFWATWCPPCVKEMPLLDSFQRAQAARGWQVVGIAIDGPTPVREFLARRPVSFPIGLAGMEGLSLTKSLGNASGQLPYSVVFGRDGQVRQARLGAVDDALLASWVDDMA